jgi:flagellar motor switch protein FliG
MKSFRTGLAIGLSLSFSLFGSPLAHGSAYNAMGAIEAAQRAAENQVRNLIEPLLSKYCHEECKLMGVSASVDLAVPDEVAPGFDDVDPKANSRLAPSSARVKLLIDEKVGPVSRGKLLELVQQYLDTLDFPVKVETQLSRFPSPVGSAGKVTELRERISRQFKGTVESLFEQFCPNHCLLADYELQTDVVNPEETQYGSSGEFVGDESVAVRIKAINGTVLVDDTLSPEERANILEMARLKTNYFKNVNLAVKAMKFPRPARYDQNGNLIEGTGGPIGLNGRSVASDQKKSESSQSTSTSASESKLNRNESSTTSSENHNSSNATNSNKSTSTNSENNARQERFERFEKIERVESGDAVQAELQKFKVYGLVFACSILSLLIFLAMSTFRMKSGGGMNTIHRVIQSMTGDPVAAPSLPASSGEAAATDRATLLGKRYEIERLREELMNIFVNQPKVAKYVFTRVLTEEGVETTAQYLDLFGESVVMDMLRDPSLQSDLAELTEFYAKNPMELKDDEKLELLKKLHNRTVAGKLTVMGSRSSNLFDFLADMDGLQILELVRNESLTVKSIVLTQLDPQKRSAIYSQLDEQTRFQLMTELSRIDYLPRDFIFNVANALKRKRRENPKLNTEALPGSDVLLTLLERTGREMQRTVVKNLELANPESARNIKSKLVSLDTLRYLRDGQLLEVVLSLKHDELLQFLKGAPSDLRATIFNKAPKDLAADLEEELENVGNLSRESYSNVERKVLNRMKLMANEGLINLVETNDRMLAEAQASAGGSGYVEAGPADPGQSTASVIRKVGGW